MLRIHASFAPVEVLPIPVPKAVVRPALAVTRFGMGSTHVVLEPLDFMARLAALVPRPRLNLTRFHGVFAPNFKHRARIVPRRFRGVAARALKLKTNDQDRRLHDFHHKNPVSDRMWNTAGDKQDITGLHRNLVEKALHRFEVLLFKRSD